MRFHVVHSPCGCSPSLVSKRAVFLSGEASEAVKLLRRDALKMERLPELGVGCNAAAVGVMSVPIPPAAAPYLPAAVVAFVGFMLEPVMLVAIWQLASILVAWKKSRKVHRALRCFN